MLPNCAICCFCVAYLLIKLHVCALRREIWLFMALNEIFFSCNLPPTKRITIQTVCSRFYIWGIFFSSLKYPYATGEICEEAGGEILCFCTYKSCVLGIANCTQWDSRSDIEAQAEPSPYLWIFMPHFKMEMVDVLLLCWKDLTGSLVLVTCESGQPLQWARRTAIN